MKVKEFEMTDNKKMIRLACWEDKINRGIRDELGNPIIYDDVTKEVIFKVCGDANMYIWDGEQQRSEMLYSGDRVKVFLDGGYVVIPSFFSQIRRMVNRVNRLPEKMSSRQVESKYGIRL